MRRMEASLRKARALRLRFSQSLASRRQRFNQAIVRSTIQRLGNGTNPLARSERTRYRRTVLREKEIGRTTWRATRWRHRDPKRQRNKPPKPKSSDAQIV